MMKITIYQAARNADGFGPIVDERARVLERTAWVFTVEPHVSTLVLRHRATRVEKRRTFRHKWQTVAAWHGVPSDNHDRRTWLPKMSRPEVDSAVAAAAVELARARVEIGAPW